MKKILLALALCITSATSNATLITQTSLTSAGSIPNSVSAVGGIVFDLIGNNGNRVISQLSASSLFKGFFNSSPGLIGTQTGWDSVVWNALGGGISEASVRLTIYDGDTGLGEFDYNDNFLSVNGVNFGNLSTVNTDATSANGLISTGTQVGFLNDVLNTGWLFINDATALTNLYTSIVNTNEVKFSLIDDDPTDNYFDFTQGIDSSLINVGSGPQVTPSVPEPSTLFIFAVAIMAFSMRKLRKA